MRGVLNGYAINGASLPSWVVRSSVLVSAEATAFVSPTRTTFASVNADASVVVTLTGNQNIAARATASAACSSSVVPNAVYAGAAITDCSAYGSASVRRFVYGEAGGDAAASGEAIVAAALGEASSSSDASVILCSAHLIRPGRSLATGLLDGSAPGLVTRMTTILAESGVGYIRAEASVKLSGESFWRNDGYVIDKVGSCLASIDNERSIIIATLGSFEFGSSESTAKPFVIHPSAALRSGIASGSVTALLERRGRVNAIGSASWSITPELIKFGEAVDFASADCLSARGFWSANGFALGEAGVDAVVTPKRTTFGSSVDVCQASASAQGARFLLGYSENLSATAFVGKALAFSNADKPAPDDRVIVVSYEYRGIIVPYENRQVAA